FNRGRRSVVTGSRGQRDDTQDDNIEPSPRQGAGRSLSVVFSMGDVPAEADTATARAQGTPSGWSRFTLSSRLAIRAGPQRGSRVGDPGRIAALRCDAGL